MNLRAQETYKYFYGPGEQGEDVKIEKTCMGNAYATSYSVAGLGPFVMCFDAETGKGKGDYIGTYLEEYDEGEIRTANYNVTYKHTGPYKDQTVFIKVKDGEDLLSVAEKAMASEHCYFDDRNGYIKKSAKWELLNDND